jgi:DNA-binding MarR family transcriptional regulator
MVKTERTQGLTIQRCLEMLRISSLSEWDLLAFVAHHGVSLIGTNQIARLIGYDGAVIKDALDRLERERLIERSRVSTGVSLYRIRVSTDSGRERCLTQFIRLSQRRAVRLLVAKQLRTVSQECGTMEPRNKGSQTAESGAEGIC